MADGFHALAVAAIEPLTDDATALTFEVPQDLLTAYAWQPGQHVAVRIAADDERRSYSLCPAPEGRLRIGVRRLPGGRFSSEVVDRIGVGDVVEVMAPAGRFGAALAGLRRPALVAAGSGITPMLAMAEAALADTQVDAVAVVVANRTQGSAMFLDDLAALKDRFPTRLQIVHVLSREQQESPVLSGRLDATRLRTIRERLLGETPDGWFLCGPQALVGELRDALVADGTPANRVHVELFHADSVPVPLALAPEAGTAAAVTLGGREAAVHIAPGETVLDAVLRQRADAPFACKGGVCGTCRARVRDGAVVMSADWALERDEIERGYVLTCQSRPTTGTLVVDYDA